MTDIMGDNPGFLADFERMSRFGATPAGGVDREAATGSDGETRAWFSNWLTSNGFTVKVDAIGNIFGLVEIVPGAPYVLVGSHLDSQPLAGRFDGAYGVLAGAHAVRAARDAMAASGTPAFNLAVVNWFNEEGSRFKPSMMGSGVYTSRIPLANALATTDRAGVTVADALDSISGRGSDIVHDVAIYAEIHVEQGRDLEDNSTTIGVVSNTWSAWKLQIRVVGEQSHIGSARMRDRKDALLGAAHLVLAARELTTYFPEEHIHTGVSELEVRPNSPVTIAREADLLVDIRAKDAHILQDAVNRFIAGFTAIEDQANVQIRVLKTAEWSSGPFLESGIQLAEQSAARLGYSHRRVPTLAGHDATNMKEIVPTILLFVPSVEGVSHNEKELTGNDDLMAGVEVFSDVVFRLGKGELDVSQ